MSTPTPIRGSDKQGDQGEVRGAAFWLVTATVFVSFAIDSFARFPVPGPNEPHYLAKARHYWMPNWCPGDLFLDSSNAHLIFYQTFGLLTRRSLLTAAIIGRLIGLLILAVGWTALVCALVPGRWAGLWAAWIFLVLAAIGNLSGEWLVGGIEAKVIAYGLLFLALALLIDGRPERRSQIPAAGALAGLAVGFHPVVGLWGLASAFFATLARRLLGRSHNDAPTPNRVPRREWPSYVMAAGLAAVAAAPGIVAGLKAAAGSSLQADYIQVTYRLAHHLDPMAFSPADLEHFWQSPWCGYSVLAVAWFVGRRSMSRREPERWFFWFVVGAGLIAACGIVVGWRFGLPEDVTRYLFPWKWLSLSLRFKVLKLYPFRLVDALLPMAVAVTVAGLARRITQASVRASTVASVWVLCGLPALAAVLHVAPDARPQMSERQLAGWLDACRWIAARTPPNALVLTPPSSSWAFKWYAQRAEFVSYKDCPQDGPGIVEWNERMLRLTDWADQNLERGFGAAETAWLRELGISYIVQPATEPFKLAPIYQNETYRVYELHDERGP